MVIEALDASLAVWAMVAAHAPAAVATYWRIAQVTLMVVAVVILLSSIDDLLIDLLYWKGAIGRSLRRLRRPPPRQRRLDLHPEKQIAVIVPAWHESEVIAGMIANTINAFDYERFHIFVGVYANDPETAAEVDRMAARFPNVHLAQVPHDGPTIKADCLNWIVRAVRDYEQGLPAPFDVYLMHDAEDVVHPYGLRVVNWFIEKRGMIQLPVLSMNRSWNAFVACHYMDEFAEFHTKDLQVRSAMTGMTPSAGVATAFSREAMRALCTQTNDSPFNTDSLTEDYDVAHRLKTLGYPSEFIRYVAQTLRFKRSLFSRKQVRVLRRELVATREHFPDGWSTSMRQKARWMLGISYLGWRQLGWFGDLPNRYFLFRDRKALLTAPVGALAYLLVLQQIGWWGVEVFWPNVSNLPPLITEDWVWTVVWINFFFLINRVLHRAWFTGRAHGLGHIWLSPIRIVVSNLISFGAFWRSMRLFVIHLVTGRKIAWDKTQHTYPSLGELQHRRGRIGDVLKFWRHLDDSALDKAVAAQRRSYRPFGLQLLDLGLVNDEHLAEAFAESAGLFAGEFDSRNVTAEAQSLLTPRDCARFVAVAESVSAAMTTIVLGEPLGRADQARLDNLLRASGARSVTFRFAPLSDVAFAIRRATDAQATGLTAPGINASRDDRRDYARLGDILVRQGAISHATLQTGLARHWSSKGRLGEHLLRDHLITREALDHALVAQSLACVAADGARPVSADVL